MTYTYVHKSFTRSKCAMCGKEYDRHALRRNNLCDECNDKPVPSTTIRWVKKDPLYKQTVEYFNNKCAYCQENDIEQVEHFIPIKLGGETSPFNCVPTCKKCNNLKAARENNIPGCDTVKQYLRDLRSKYPDYHFTKTHNKNGSRKKDKSGLPEAQIPTQKYYDEFLFSVFTAPGRQAWIEEPEDFAIRREVRKLMQLYVYSA